MGALQVSGTITLGGLLVNVSTTIQIPTDLQADAQTAVNSVKAFCATNAAPFNLTFQFTPKTVGLT